MLFTQSFPLFIIAVENWSVDKLVFFKAYGIPQHYGLFYAMGLALTMEGLLSACYHICPSFSNFQFGKWSKFVFIHHYIVLWPRYFIVLS